MAQAVHHDVLTVLLLAGVAFALDCSGMAARLADDRAALLDELKNGGRDVTVDDLRCAQKLGDDPAVVDAVRGRLGEQWIEAQGPRAAAAIRVLAGSHGGPGAEVARSLAPYVELRDGRQHGYAVAFLEGGVYDRTWFRPDEVTAALLDRVPDARAVGDRQALGDAGAAALLEDPAAPGPRRELLARGFDQLVLLSVSGHVPLTVTARIEALDEGTRRDEALDFLLVPFSGGPPSLPMDQRLRKPASLAGGALCLAGIGTFAVATGMWLAPVDRTDDAYLALRAVAWSGVGVAAGGGALLGWRLADGRALAFGPAALAGRF